MNPSRHPAVFSALTIVSLVTLAISPCFVSAQNNPSAGASGPDWEVVRKIERTKRILTKGEDGVIYDEKSGKFYRPTKVKLMEDQMLTVQVFSAYYQPQVIVEDEGGQKLKTSTHLPARETRLEDGQEASLRATQLEFLPPDRGVYTIRVTTQAIDQGPYQIQGAIWKPRLTAAQTGSLAEASLTVEENTEAIDKPSFSQSYKYKRSYRDPHNPDQFGHPSLQMSIDALWTQDGHSYPPSPVPALDAPNVDTVRDNVIYFQPIKDADTGEVVRLQATAFDPDRDIVVMLRAEGPYAHLLPELVEEGKKILAQYAGRARPRK